MGLTHHNALSREAHPVCVGARTFSGGGEDVVGSW